tara:strand:+ start:319 stop:609 length:291 start_codon:yes stop_codon:yes gene_type:complete
MSHLRRAARVDANQAEIVAHMREMGACVYLIGMPVDLLVGINCKTALVEVKDPKSRYGKKGLNPNQQSFKDSWLGGTVCQVNDVQGATTLIKVMQA